MTPSGIFGFLGGGKRKTTVESLCPAGLHQVDPNWTRQGTPCPYCEGEKSKPAATLDAAAPTPAAARNDKEPARSQRGGTIVDDGGDFGGGGSGGGGSGGGGGGGAAAAPSPHRPTTVDGAPGRGPIVQHGGSGNGRRIQGILTTFTWSASGDLYVIRDGRNYVGSGEVAADNNAPCDVLIPNDKRMSSAHFLILLQQGKPVISDVLSLNGTEVNGVLIDGRGIELADNAVIKAGDSVFVFQKVRRSESAPVAVQHRADADVAHEEKPRSPRRETDIE